MLFFILFPLLLNASLTFCGEITLEDAPRNLISRINLLQCYQKTNNPEYKEQEYKTLKKIVTQKMSDELELFKTYKKSAIQEFLTIAQTQKLLTPKQTLLFQQLTAQPLNNKNMFFKAMAIWSVVLLLFFNMYG